MSKIKQEIPEFNKNCVLDNDIFKYSYLDVQKQLEKYNSCLLKNPKVLNHTIPGVIESICKNQDINPKLILTLLEKHYKLVTSIEIPANETLDRCLNMGVSDRSALTPFLGIAKQIFACAGMHKKYFEVGQRKMGKEMSIGDGEITPENQATFALYMCDPYIGIEDLYSNDIVKDENGFADNYTKVEWKKFLWIIPYKKVVTKVIRENKNLIKKTPFGVYKTWKVWSELFI